MKSPPEKARYKNKPPIVSHLRAACLHTLPSEIAPTPLRKPPVTVLMQMSPDALTHPQTVVSSWDRAVDFEEAAKPHQTRHSEPSDDQQFTTNLFMNQIKKTPKNKNQRKKVRCPTCSALYLLCCANYNFEKMLGVVVQWSGEKEEWGQGKGIFLSYELIKKTVIKCSALYLLFLKKMFENSFFIRPTFQFCKCWL